jgi:hypothetical protein
MESFNPMPHVIEVATFDLQAGVSVEEFTKLDLRVKNDHVAKQPGYLSRESGFDNQTWLVIVHWKSVEYAEASMNSFMTAPLAADFMKSLNVSTMKMSRYIASN